MTVRDLIEEIKRCKKKYGEEFDDWDIYTEQCTQFDKKYKRKAGWETVKDSEKWEYFKCFGFNTEFPKERIFTVNVNY